MSKYLTDSTIYPAIAAAIRQKNGESTIYKPAEMAQAILDIDAGYPEPTGTVQITTNGTHNVKDYASASVNVPNSYAASDEDKVVQSGALVAQTTRTVTANGTYDTTTNNSVVVDVEGGGGTPIDSQSIVDFVVYTSSNVQLEEDSGGNVVIKKSPIEYQGNIYGNAGLIQECGLMLLGDFSQGGEVLGNSLNDSIANYSAVLLQGIYKGNRTSGYNTSMLYISPQIGTAYWAGMKDRNSSYDCNVTFTDSSTVSLSGNKQVIIYGIP